MSSVVSSPKIQSRARHTHPRRSLANLVRVLQAELPNLAAKYHIQALGIFGSYVRGQEKPRSDLDLVVEYARPIGVDARSELVHSLSMQLKLKVEVIQKESLPPFIRKRVMRDALWLQKDGIPLPVMLPRRNANQRNGRRKGDNMEPEREYLDFLQDMLDNMARVQRFVKDVTKEQMIADDKTDFAVRYALQTIGEAANRVPNDIRKMYPKIPWRAVIDFRNAMAHGYDRMMYDKVWESIHISIPRDEALVAHLLQAEKQRRGIESDES